MNAATRDIEIAAARAAFVAARKRDNAESNRRPVSLAKDWTGQGFKDCNVDSAWARFLEGWMARARHNAPE